jgi:spore germination protein PC
VILNSEWYTYSIQLQRYLEAQDKRILQLEQELQRLTEEVSMLKNKPPIHVDKIEYKFDQLKVESLDGTLNIGLNPNDLNNIDEFAVNHQSTSPPPFQFPNREQVVQEMAETLMSELDEMIQDTEDQVGISLDPSYHEFIRNDVSRQLEQRIIMYFDNSSPMDRAPQQFEHLKENVYEKVKSDIHVALVNFITHSTGQTGGNHNNGI